MLIPIAFGFVVLCCLIMSGLVLTGDAPLGIKLFLFVMLTGTAAIFGYFVFLLVVLSRV